MYYRYPSILCKFLIMSTKDVRVKRCLTNCFVLRTPTILPQIRISCGIHPTFILMLGRVIKSQNHLCASTPWFMTFDPGIFILDEKHHYSSMDMSIATEPFVLVTKPHSKRVEGFPLDSLSIDIGSGKYYYDLEVKDVSTSVDEGVRKFFMTILSK